MDGVHFAGRVCKDRIGGAAAFEGAADPVAIIGGYCLGDDQVALEIEFVAGGEDIVVDIKIDDAFCGNGGGGRASGKEGIGIGTQFLSGYGLDAGLGADGGVGGHVGDDGDPRTIVVRVDWSVVEKDGVGQVAEVVLSGGVLPKCRFRVS